jgi:hypothetical protein
MRRVFLHSGAEKTICLADNSWDFSCEGFFRDFFLGNHDVSTHAVYLYAVVGKVTVIKLLRYVTSYFSLLS